MITPGQALWIMNNLPQNPPSSSIMPSVWQNSRRQVLEELQMIVDAEQSVQADGALPPLEITTDPAVVIKAGYRANAPRR